MPFAIEPGLHPLAPVALGWLALGLMLLVAVKALTHQGGRAWSAAIVYVGAGLVAAMGVALLDVRWLEPLRQPGVIEHVCELALVVALFANGVRLDRELRWGDWAVPARLLLVALPLSIAALAALAGSLLGLGLAAAIALAAALSPTDPVLAGDVGETVPGEDETDAEFAITSEASLNDGLAAPFVVLALLVATEGRDAATLLEWAAVDLIGRCVLGVLVGVAAGRVAGRVLPRQRDEGQMTSAFDGILTAGLALAAFGLGELVGGYGFLSAFAAGVAFRRAEAEHVTHGEVHEGALRVERLLELVVLLLVFSSVTLDGLAAPGVGGWVLAVLAILVVRPVVAYASLLGQRPRMPRERLYVAWFGVRGIGTFFYAAAAIGAGVLPAAEAELVWWTAVITVGISVVAHGVTSGPFTRRLATG